MISDNDLRNDSTPFSQNLPEASPGYGLPKWVLPLLLIVVGTALLMYLFRSGITPVPDTRAADTTASVTPVTDSAIKPPPADLRESLKIELPDGTVLDAYKGGIEDQLVAFLKDKSAKVSKDKWFDFDDLNFNTGTAEITRESRKQIDNIVAILKAFPGARIKIGGYTDKTGNDAANLALSENRAEAVRALLSGAGVGSQVIDAEGYGSQFAKAAVDAPESEKLHDRRVSVSVREK